MGLASESNWAPTLHCVGRANQSNFFSYAADELSGVARCSPEPLRGLQPIASAAIRVYQGRLVSVRGSSEGTHSGSCRVQLRKNSPDVIPNCGSLRSWMSKAQAVTDCM